MSFDKFEFTKENIDDVLKDLGKEYRKLNKNGPEAEIIIVGGASALLNYSFRNTTIDIDALIFATSSFKDAINKVGDKYELPNSWINNDFKQTDSYSDKLIEHSKYYKTFYGSLAVRTISGEYMIAMKLVSDRIYKKDGSDIVGIIRDERNNGHDISYEDIDKAVVELYGDWDRITDEAKTFLLNVLNNEDLDSLYEDVSNEEITNRNTLLFASEKYADVITEDNVNDFISHFREDSDGVTGEDLDTNGDIVQFTNEYDDYDPIE